MSVQRATWVAVPRERDAEPVREFGAMTDDLHALGDWLLVWGIDTVALESTGVYWMELELPRFSGQFSARIQAGSGSSTALQIKGDWFCCL